MYPKTKEGEFISLSSMQFSDIINKSKDWDGSSPYIPDNELFMTTDLTENDIVVRQINCAKIIDRLLMKALSNENKKAGSYVVDKSAFDYETDFYGRKNYWFKISLPMKIITFLYLIMFFPCRIAIGLLSFLSPLSQLNIVLSLEKKRESFKKCK
jgi:hypothetical protein